MVSCMDEKQPENQSSEGGGSPVNASARAEGPVRRPASGLTWPAGLGLAFGFAPLLARFFVNLWRHEYYQFFPMALAGAAFLAWTRGKEAPRPLVPGHPALTGLFMGGAFLLLGAGTWLWSSWLGGIAAFLCLMGIVWWIGGGKLFRALLPALLMVLIVMPPPWNLDAELMQQLRTLAVVTSSRMLDLLDVTHTLSGNIIELPGERLLVEEACSGINSVLFGTTACLFYGLWRRRSATRILIGMGSIVAFVVLGNMVRITLGAWLKYSQGVDILSGWKHETVGLVLFTAYMTLILSMDAWLSFLTAPVPWLHPNAPTPAAVPTPVAETKNSPRIIPAGWGMATASAFALLGIAGLGLGWEQYRHTQLQHGVTAKMSSFTMPEQFGEWKRLNEEVPTIQKIETRGMESQIWQFRRGEMVALVALDYPFRGPHDLMVCYTKAGWTIGQKHRQSSAGPDATPPFVGWEMKREPVGCGNLWYCMVDEHGRWLDNLGQWQIGGGNEPITYQMQVLVTGYAPFAAAEKEQARQLFEEARMRLFRQLFPTK